MTPTNDTSPPVEEQADGTRQGIQGIQGLQGIQGVQGIAGDPIASAVVLTQALTDNTNALRSVRNRYRIVLGFLIVTLLLLAATLYTRYDQRVSSCHRDNNLRQANLDLWSPFLVREPTKPGPDATQEEIDKYEQSLQDRKDFQATLDKGFALRDCGSIGWL